VDGEGTGVDVESDVGANVGFGAGVGTALEFAISLGKLSMMPSNSNITPDKAIPILGQYLLGLSAGAKRSRKPTTKSDPRARFAPNQLNRELTAEQPKSKWVTDTKAVETAEGWLYLAVILDLFSRMVVGWAMAPSEDSALVELALRMAVARRHPEVGLLHHADRGTEFTCDRYQVALRELGIEVSMSRTGNCWDNAAMESFFATLTKECTDRTRFQSRQQARSAIFEYLECFYNPIRLHSTLPYVSPVAFELATESRMS